MLRDILEIVQEGDGSGNGMAVRLRFPSGLEVIGLATKNTYGGDWDYGPTWNYLVCGDRPFLLDTGRRGTGRGLIKMMEVAGRAAKDVDDIVISHGHEDHDGDLSEVAAVTGARVRAHEIYDRLIRFYPDQAPAGARKDFPASCWHCFLPDSFPGEFCVDYHYTRSQVEVVGILGREGLIGEGIKAYHLPGHSPDALGLTVGSEVILVGDNVLPGITPYPTRESFSPLVSRILDPDYGNGVPVYGLRAYIKSLKKIKAFGEHLPEALVLPSHRLFHEDQWHEIDLKGRVDEIIEHHIARCAAILELLGPGPQTARELATAYFAPGLLKGMGIFMAENEIHSHCELMHITNDVFLTEPDTYEATGDTNFEGYIRSLQPY